MSWRHVPRNVRAKARRLGRRAGPVERGRIDWRVLIADLPPPGLALGRRSEVTGTFTPSAGVRPPTPITVGPGLLPAVTKRESG
jgi:hypothetical protein